MHKPYSESCDQNREPILAILRRLFTARHTVLEIGSGTGQHAVYFSEQLPHLVWQTSDREEYHSGIRMWLDEAALANVNPPLVLDARSSAWPVTGVAYAFTANSVHIMDDAAVVGLFAGLGGLLKPDGLFVCYGPFNYNGRYTSDSNRAFDGWLKARDPASGIKDIEWLNKLADQAEMRLIHDFEMPANNRILVWQKG